MKKIILALAVLLAVQVADAQTKSPADAKKAVESAEAASQDAKKATKVATWLKLAEAYVDAYNAPAGAAWIGASKQELQMPSCQGLLHHFHRSGSSVRFVLQEVSRYGRWSSQPQAVRHPRAP